MNLPEIITERYGEIKPIVELKTPRKNCPFYGFHMARGLMLDSKGNQCAPTGEYRPCMMEINGKEPNWGACPYFNTDEFKRKLEEYADDVRVFPEEFGENGLSLREWIQYMANVRN